MQSCTAILLAANLMSMPVGAAETVTIDNFIRAETHFYMAGQVASGCFAKLCHQARTPPVDNQPVIRINRDTLYSQGVFDLSTPLTITMPDAGKRYQMLSVINEDHLIRHVSYTAGPVTLTREMVGSRYAFVIVRTFVQPNNAADARAVAALQAGIGVAQASPGAFEVPEWNQDQRAALRSALLGVGRFMPDSRRTFGDAGDTDPVRRLVGTAGGWGGIAERDAIYLNERVANNDGVQPYVLTVGKVPVDAFWSVTVYNAKGFYEGPETAISLNNVSARQNEDGTTTIRFGGDPRAPNALRIMPGWNYTVRLYRPRPEILDGRWRFPAAKPAG
ncbi:DUF1214 domain-containing protein [Sandaracinobacteroides saxicola]|uniref:DUF1214 domain-containing protein n=2 Tax=Sandaracinobacteroides saxicola TaxID=2759707 RepID=A0A7G5IDR2_9SPHN|nr:DUF1214 domain-containing protein [Sandaracinobacteroides saxicola]